jgi:hypothetical protein
MGIDVGNAYPCRAEKHRASRVDGELTDSTLAVFADGDEKQHRAGAAIAFGEFEGVCRSRCRCGWANYRHLKTNSGPEYG